MSAEQAGLLQKILYLNSQLRVRNFIPTLITALIGYTLTSSRKAENLEILLVIVALFCFCAFFALQNDINDYQDDKHGRRSSPLICDKFNLRDLRIISLVFLLLGILATALTVDMTVYFASLIFILLCTVYNKPFVRNNRPILSIIILALVMGGIPFVTGVYTSGGKLNQSFAIMAIGIFLYRCSISILKDYKDYKEDKNSKKQTCLKKYGGLTIRNASLILSLVGYSLLLIGLKLALVIDKRIIILTLLSVFAIYQFTLRLNLGTDKSSYVMNSQIFGRVYTFSLYFDLAVLLCLYIF